MAEGELASEHAEMGFKQITDGEPEARLKDSEGKAGLTFPPSSGQVSSNRATPGRLEWLLRI